MVSDNGSNTRNQENELLSRIESYLKNKISIEDLFITIKLALVKLEEFKKEFYDNISEQPEELKKICNESLDLIDIYFSLYKEALDEVLLSDRDIKIIYDKIIDISKKLNNEMSIIQMKALEVMGPTQIPDINLIINLAEEVINKGEPLDFLQEQVLQEKTLINDIIKNQKDLSPLFKDIYIEIKNILERFLEYFKNKDMNLLESLIDELIGAAKKFEDLQEEENNSLSLKPTGSPLVNIVINCARMAQRGEMDIEILEKNVDSLWNQMQNMKFQFMAITKAKAESDKVEEESEILGDILQAFEEVLSSYYDIIDQKDFSNLDEAEQKLIIVIEELNNSMKIFEDISIKKGKIFCVKCKHENSQNRLTCEKCNATLPVLSSAGNSDSESQLDIMESVDSNANFQETYMTEKVQYLFEAAQDLSQGSISSKKFGTILDEMEMNLEKAYENVGPVPDIKKENIPKGKNSPKELISLRELKDTLEETSELYLQGLEDFEVGLSFMRQFALSPSSSENLQLGMQMIWESLGKLQKVQQVTKHMVS